MKLNLKGLGTALVTPFKPDGTVDIERVKSLAARQIENGVDFLIPCGTTGEAVTLTDDEYAAVVSAVVEAAHGKAPVIAGSGSNSTERTIRQSKDALACGANGLLVVGPYYNKPTQEGYYRHYKTIAEAVQAPIIMYNVPGRTGGNILPETQLRIAGIDYIVATKEASGNLAQNMAIVQNRPEGFSVLSGDDNLALAQIAIGMDGLISVASNEVPAEMAALIHHAMAGDWEMARKVHYRLLDLLEGNFIESSPIPVKTAMAMMGLIDEEFRLPLVPMGGNNQVTLRAILHKLGLLKAH